MIAKIYKITNPKGKVYIGSTIQDINRRWRVYKRLYCKGQIKIYNSILKYGVDSHSFEIIWQGEPELMIDKEIEFGTLYNVLSVNGLNLKLPKIGDTFICTSDETRKRLSNNMKGKTHTAETKLKMSLAKLGKPRDQETRDKIRKAFSKKVKDTASGKIFDSIKHAASSTKYSIDSISKMLNGTTPNKTTLVFYTG